MAKAKLKLSLEQESDSILMMTAEEAKELADILSAQAKVADSATDGNKEGRIELESTAGRIVVTVSKVTIEKDDDDET